MLLGFIGVFVGIVASPLVMDYSNIPQPYYDIALLFSAYTFAIGVVAFTIFFIVGIMKRF